MLVRQQWVQQLAQQVDTSWEKHWVHQLILQATAAVVVAAAAVVLTLTRIDLTDEMQLNPLRTVLCIKNKNYFETFFKLLCNTLFSKQWSLKEPLYHSLRYYKVAQRLIQDLWDQSFSTFAKFSEKLKFFTPWYTYVCVCIRW